MNAFLIAIQFLTRIPVKPNYGDPDATTFDLTESIYWYGIVGLVIGSALWATSGFIHWLNPAMNTSVLAAITILVWVLITGALHLDGLADSADAWLGGNNPEKVLTIMKDPRSGPAGIVAIVVVLLLKFATLEYLFQTQASSVYLFLAPGLARAAIPYLFLTTRYVGSSQGLGSPFEGTLSFTRTHQWFGITLLILAIITPIYWIVVSLLTLAFVYWALRVLMMQKIKGLTGDTAGATIEITETAILLGLSLLV